MVSTVALLTNAAAFTTSMVQAVSLKEMSSGFTSPIHLESIQTSKSGEQWIVVDQVGVIYRVDPASGEKSEFLDLRSRLIDLNQGAFDERGALGFAAHPDFTENGRVFVYYSAPLREGAPEGWNHTSHISEFHASAEEGRLKVDPGSEKIILQIDEPQFNHNSGSLAFGPDGFLYISVGDGGAGNDDGLGHTEGTGNAQDISNLLGSILRIDVNSGSPYSVPEDNPFVGQQKGRKEIYAYGLRNIWRMRFDPGGDRQLFASDVGQNHYEEVNIITKGGNYGWKIREGMHCFHPTKVLEDDDCPKVAADGTPLIDPIIEYKNLNKFRNDPEAFGICIAGGAVYRGKGIPKMNGCYIFADWSRNWGRASGTALVGFPPGWQGQEKWSARPMKLADYPDGVLNAYITGIGQDASGEVYILTNDSNRLAGATGKIFKIVP